MAFNHAHDFAMRDPTFNIYQNHYAPLPSHPGDILLQAQAVEALHTSATVGDISNCHPTTREKVTEDIMDWVVRAAGADQGPVPRKAILWFSGPAGGGKTSIMRGVVDRCATTGFSTLSFFFSIRGSGVTTVRPFVATIIHQLVALHSVLRPIIYNAIRDRPTIFKESLEFQIERVLVEPFQSSPPKIVIAIDGLDECREEREREHLLNALHSLVTRLPPLIVIIASRPEFDLRRYFARPKLNDVTESIKLHNYDGSNDIRVFVSDELEEIRQSHPLRGTIPEGWQPEEIVELLVDQSSGNFIVPATAMKYIRTSRRNPVDSLNIIVGLLKNPSSTSKPFAELDALYSQILHPSEADLSLIKQILHCIIGITSVDYGCLYLSSSFLDNFLELPPGTTVTTLCDLHSVLYVPEIESEDDFIKFHHASLVDYLLDPERSSDFFQSLYKTQLDLTILCATHLTRWGSNPVANRSPCIGYSSVYWHAHLTFCTDEKPVLAETLPDIIMNLDPRNAMIFSFIHTFPMSAISNDIANTLHAALCSKRRCVRLCQLATRVNNCTDRCQALLDTLMWVSTTERFDAISRFKSETGLFEPLHPDNRVVFNKYGRAQFIRGGRLDNEDEGDRADITGMRMDDSGRSAIVGREARPRTPGSRRESLDGKADLNDKERRQVGRQRQRRRVRRRGGGESGDDLRANMTDGQPSLDLMASSRKTAGWRTKDSRANTMGGSAGGSSGSVIAAGNGPRALQATNSSPKRGVVARQGKP